MNFRDPEGNSLNGWMSHLHMPMVLKLSIDLKNCMAMRTTFAVHHGINAKLTTVLMLIMLVVSK